MPGTGKDIGVLLCGAGVRVDLRTPTRVVRHVITWPKEPLV